MKDAMIVRRKINRMQDIAIINNSSVSKEVLVDKGIYPEQAIFVIRREAN